MAVLRKPSIFALACLGLASLAAAQGSSDWKTIKMDPNLLAAKAEKMMRSFNHVACGGAMNYTVPIPHEKPGHGRALFNGLFWSPKVFRFDYLVFADHPTKEYLASDGKTTKRLGPAVGAKNTAYRPSSGVFNAASQTQLVEAFPMHFSKFLFSTFAGGNATLQRYVKALTHGVGGYTLSVQKRTLVRDGHTFPQYRLIANRGNVKAKTDRFARVEIVFDARIGLPVAIHTQKGKVVDFNWSGQWYNHAKLTGSPFLING